MSADPKPPQRKRDRELLRAMHLRVRNCALEDNTCVHDLSVHHIHKHPRDDVVGNLVVLCGDGTRGHHGRIENHDDEACRRLGEHILRRRPDAIEYLSNKLGGKVEAHEWLRRYLHV